MAASLRIGMNCVLQNCRAWTQTAFTSVLQMQNFSNRLLGYNDYSTLSSYAFHKVGALDKTTGILSVSRPSLQPAVPLLEQIRTKVRYSRRDGKPKSVISVPERFYRLNWGIWIRTHAGRGKRLWKKTLARKYRLRQHVFCNRSQSKLLDKMVTDFWKRPKYWVNDPYEPYHKRQNFDKFFPEKSRPFYP